MAIARFAEDKDLNWIIGFDRGDMGEEFARIYLKKRRLVIAEVEGRPAGLLRLDYFNLRFPLLGEIQVSSLYPNQDIEAALFQFLEIQLRNEGHTFILSSSTAQKNAPEGWHEAMGFEKWGSVKDFDGDGKDEIFFRKSLR